MIKPYMVTRRVVGEVTGKRRGWPGLMREMPQRWVGWRGGGCVGRTCSCKVSGVSTVEQLREDEEWVW